MKLDFAVVIEAMIQVRGTGFSQFRFINGIYTFIGEQNIKYHVEDISEGYASNVKTRKAKVRSNIVDGAYDPLVVATMPNYVKKSILPKLQEKKYRDLVDTLLNIIRSDSQIGLTAKERMEHFAADMTKLPEFLSEVILYTLQHALEDTVAPNRIYNFELAGIVPDSNAEANLANMMAKGLPIIKDGVRNFLSLECKNHLTNTISFSDKLLPDVIDVGKWMGGLRCSFIDAVMLLWQQPVWDGIFLGNSGAGKSSSFLACAQYILGQNHALPIFIKLHECFNDLGEKRILKYIQRHYAPTLSIDEIENTLLSPRARATKPDVIFFIDGLSDCIALEDTNDSVSGIQQEFLSINKPHVQLVFSAVNEIHPFTLGKISKQVFEIQNLSVFQIQRYLDSMSIKFNNRTPYEVLSNPFMLTIYAQTEEFLAAQRSHLKNRFRANVYTEADVLFNFFEAIAVKFIENATSKEKSKVSFAFDFVLPKLAFSMVSNVRYHISKGEIDDCAKQTVLLLQDKNFTAVFDDHYNQDYSYKINKLIAWFVQQTGIMMLSDKGYTFSNDVFRNFLCAKHVYNFVLMQNNTGELCESTIEALESHSLTYRTRKYLGELCEEYQNKPYQNSSGEWLFPCKKRLLLDTLDCYRDVFSTNAKIAVSNIVATMAICRNNDLSGVNLSLLDLRRLTFSNIVCSRKSQNRYVAANFSGSYIDQWFFRTVQYCRDRASVKFIRNLQLVAVSDGAGSINLFNYTGDFVDKIVTGDNFIQSIDISPDEDSILISCLNTGIYKYDLAAKKLTHIIEPYGTLFGVAKYLSIDSFAYCMRDKKVFVYNLTDSNRICEIDYSANSFCYDEERKALILTSRSREVVRYNLYKRSFERRHSTADISDSYIMETKFYSGINTMFACTKGGVVTEWNPIKTEATSVYQIKGEVDDFVLSSDWEIIYCVTEKHGLYAIHRATNQIVQFPIEEPGRWSAISANDNLLAIASVEGGLILFDINTHSQRIVASSNSDYHEAPLLISGCSFRNAVFSSDISENFLLALQSEGANITNVCFKEAASRL